MKITLTPEEVTYCIGVGTRRQQTNVKNSIASKQFTQRDPTTIHIQGVLAEYAFARLCEQDCKLDLQIKITLDDTRSRGCKSVDWTVFGKTIDVKSTLNNTHHVYAPRHKARYPANFYVLMWIDLPYHGTHDERIWACMREPSPITVTFQGFVPHTTLFMNSASLSPVLAVEANPKWEQFLDQIWPENNKCIRK
jgi:hypothetical protein